MLDLIPWKERLIDAHTDLKKVDIAANPALAMRDMKQYPASYFIATSDNAGRNSLDGGAVQQEVESLVGVLTGIKHSGSTSGAVNSEELRTIRLQIDGCILGWQPDDACYPIEYRSGRILMFSNQVLYWMDLYKTAYNKRKV